MTQLVIEKGQSLVAIARGQSPFILKLIEEGISKDRTKGANRHSSLLRSVRSVSSDGTKDLSSLRPLKPEECDPSDFIYLFKDNHIFVYSPYDRFFLGRSRVSNHARLIEIEQRWIEEHS